MESNSLPPAFKTRKAHISAKTEEKAHTSASNTEKNALLPAFKTRKPHTSGKTKQKPHPSAEQKPHPSAELKPHPSAEQNPHTSAEQKPRPSAEQKPHPSAEQNPHTSAEQKPHPSAEQNPHISAETEKEALPPASKTEEEATTTAITVSNIPVKEEDLNNMWIPALELYLNDKQVLMSTRWVNDNIVSVAQQLLKQQCQGKVFGWASPQCSRRSVPDKFPPVPEHSLFVQILNIGGCHWLTTTNIDTNIKYASSGANTVRI